MTRMMRVLASVAFVLPLSACLDDPTGEANLPSPSGPGVVPCWKVADESSPRTLPTTIVHSMEATIERATDEDECSIDDAEDLGIEGSPAKFVERSQGRRFLPPP